MPPPPAVDSLPADAASRMSPMELRAGASLASLFALRMLGLFLILPVFAVHAPRLAGGDNLTLVGIALGAYGLAQAILQLPFGMASDRFGRKPVIALGLIIFALGSFLAASATDIYVAIAGRALQGAGAISSVVVALAADLTREEHRTKTMGMIGATIGFTFAVSLVAAPILYEHIGMDGLFVLTGVLALAGLAVVFGAIPDVPQAPHDAAGPAPSLVQVLVNPELARLNFGIFALHLVQMAMFVVIPAALIEAGLPLAAHWKAYLPVVLASFALMVPPIMYADRRNRPQPVMAGAVGLMLVVQAGLMFAHGLAALVGLLLLFFAAFNVLEAMLPSLVSRIAPERARGSAIGVYNTTQTMGLFAGGLAGGWMAKHFGAAAVFALGAALMLAWLGLVAGMRPVNPAKPRSLTVEANTA
jgi:MFS family permease